MWLTDLEKLADPKYGLVVRFENGWERRGASGGAQMKAVAGALWHHDVAPRSGTYPLRHMLRDGRKGLSGPLAHIGFDRDGVVHVIGAGKANHAGTGKVPGVVRNGGNTRLVGIEMTSAGTRPWDWTAAQLRQMPRLGAALGDIFGYGPSKNWAHYEYSDGGKIDPAGLPGAMPGLRSRIAAARFGGISGGGATVPRPSVPSMNVWDASPRIRGMSKEEVKEIQARLAELGYDLGSYGVDGSYGRSTYDAVRAFQTARKLSVDGVAGPDTRKALSGAQAAPAKRPAAPAKRPAAPAKRPALDEDGKLGAATAKRIQTWLGVSPDGVIGPKTLRAWQKAHGTPVDGKITGQGTAARPACPAIRRDCLLEGSGGSKLVSEVQIATGLKGKDVDGKLGPASVKALQRHYNRLG